MLGKKTPILKSVDKAAKLAARQLLKSDRGFKGGKVGRLKQAAKGVAGLFPAKGQEAIVRIYRSRLVDTADHKIYFEVWDLEAGTIVKKACAFASAAIAVELHRHHSYRLLFNSNPKYPIIERVIEEVEIQKPN